MPGRLCRSCSGSGPATTRSSCAPCWCSARIVDGRLDDAERELERIDQLDEREAIFGGAAVRQIGRAELALARGDVAAGLRIYRECAARMRELGFPGMPRTGLEPWALFGDAMALTRARLSAQRATMWRTGGSCFAEPPSTASRSSTERTRTSTTRSPGWCCSRSARGVCCAEATADDAVRLLALADRFAYNRTIPTMAWERIAPRAEEAAPGRLGGLQAEYAGSRPPDLLGEAQRVVERLPA